MRRVEWAGAICIAVILGLGVYAILRSHVLHGEVTPRSLYLSAEDAAEAESSVDFPGPRRCRRIAPPREWECELLDAEGSGGRVTYRVRVHLGSSCWDGAGGGRGRPPRISGCVYMDP